MKTMKHILILIQAGVLLGDAANNANYPPGSQYDV